MPTADVAQAVDDLVKAAMREAGRRGGFARAAVLSPERRREIAQAAGRKGGLARAERIRREREAVGD